MLKTTKPQHSPDFNDRPGSGKHTTDRLNVF